MKLKYFFGVCIVLTFLPSACQPELPVFTATPTVQLKYPTSTSTLIPTTPTPEISQIESGVLTAEQRSRLSSAALRYVGDTVATAIQVSHSVDSYGVYPASICGPLSIAILQDAGLLDPAVDRHSFWKLDPRPDVDLPLLQQTFPKERYLWYSFRTPINEFDFHAFPLYPGDFLYLYAGDMGSFEHMLVVSRVDDAGRVYAVTNLLTPVGYLIQEKMLYDPNQPGEGLFYDWTNQANWQLGLTGFGGFDLWRLKSTPQDPNSQEATLASQLESVFSSAGGEWNMVFEE